MQVLDIGLGNFKVTLHVCIVFRVRSSFQGIQTISTGSFEVWVLHLGLILHLNLQYPNLYLPSPTGILGFHCNTYTRIFPYQLNFWGFVAIPTPILTFTNWNFGVSLQYLHPYLLLPTGILELCCNTCTFTYLYQLEFWGLITILALVLTSTNWDFGAYLQYLHLTLILSLSLCFCISHFSMFITWKQ